MSPLHHHSYKCNYHLADTKMRFPACGHSRCYLEFLNFRRGNREKKTLSLFLSLPLSVSLFFSVVLVFGGEPKGRSYTREEEGEEEEEEKRMDGAGGGGGGGVEGW